MLDLPQLASSPAAPASGRGRVYLDDRGQLVVQDDAGDARPAQTLGGPRFFGELYIPESPTTLAAVTIQPIAQAGDVGYETIPPEWLVGIDNGGLTYAASDCSLTPASESAAGIWEVTFYAKFWSSGHWSAPSSGIYGLQAGQSTWREVFCPYQQLADAVDYDVVDFHGHFPVVLAAGDKLRLMTCSYSGAYNHMAEGMIYARKIGEVL